MKHSILQYTPGFISAVVIKTLYSLKLIDVVFIAICVFEIVSHPVILCFILRNSHYRNFRKGNDFQKTTISIRGG